jgi:hypothetical protein
MVWIYLALDRDQCTVLDNPVIILRVQRNVRKFLVIEGLRAS